MEKKYNQLFTNNYGAYAIKAYDGAITMYDCFTEQETVLSTKTARNTTAKLLYSILSHENIGAVVICSPPHAISVVAVNLEQFAVYSYDVRKKNIFAILDTLNRDNSCGIRGVGVLAIGKNLEEAMDNAIAFENNCRDYIFTRLENLSPEYLAGMVMKNTVNKKKYVKTDIESVEGGNND